VQKEKEEKVFRQEVRLELAAICSLRSPHLQFKTTVFPPLEFKWNHHQQTATRIAFPKRLVASMPKELVRQSGNYYYLFKRKMGHKTTDYMKWPTYSISLYTWNALHIGNKLHMLSLQWNESLNG